MFLKYTHEERVQLQNKFPQISHDFLSDGLYDTEESEKIQDEILQFIKENMPHIIEEDQEEAFYNALIREARAEGRDNAVWNLINQKNAYLKSRNNEAQRFSDEE